MGLHLCIRSLQNKMSKMSVLSSLLVVVVLALCFSFASVRGQEDFDLMDASNCTDYTDCRDCASQPNCGWCPAFGMCWEGPAAGPFYKSLVANEACAQKHWGLDSKICGDDDDAKRKLAIIIGLSVAGGLFVLAVVATIIFVIVK